MNAARKRGPACFFAIMMMVCCIPMPAYSSYLYKQYIVRRIQNQEILCEAYIVAKDDYVLKLFRRKGELSHADFPEFLNIFRRINPHITDINTILPEQQILIPLAKLKPDELPGQSTGIVKIPFVSIRGLPELLKRYSDVHEIRKGEAVSEILGEEFGWYRTRDYQEGLRLLKQMNPEIKDINKVYPGQTIHIPRPEIRNELWYPSLFETFGRIPHKKRSFSKAANAGKRNPALRPPQKSIENPYLKAADILKAELLDQGQYYFPGKGDASDLKLNLTRTPMMQLKDGSTILFYDGRSLSAADRNHIRTSRPSVDIVSVPPDPSSAELLNRLIALKKKSGRRNTLSFSREGVRVEVQSSWMSGKPSQKKDPGERICLSLIDHQDQATPDSIRSYLKKNNILINDILKTTTSEIVRPTAERHDLQTDASGAAVTIQADRNRRIFIEKLVTALGYRYASNIGISFPYYGIQVDAVSNMISDGNGQELLVDFGELYGDALSEIRKSGLNIISLDAADRISVIIRKILKALKLNFTENPTFLAASRPRENNVSITMEGFNIATSNNGKKLIVKAPVPQDIVAFLTGRQFDVIMIEFQSLTSSL